MTKLLYRMVIAAMAGDDERLKELHEAYARESRLHVPIGEILREQQPWMHHFLTYHAAEDDAAKNEIAASAWGDLNKQLVKPTVVELEKQMNLVAAYLTEHQKRIAKIMEEPPRPGRGVI